MAQQGSAQRDSRSLLAAWALSAAALVTPAICGAASPLAEITWRPGASSGLAAADYRRQLDVFAQQGRGHPREISRELGHWLARLSPAHPLRAEALQLLGELQADLGDRPALDAVLERLEPLAVTDAGARAAALLVRARWERTHGSVGRAGRLVADALEQLPANAPPLRRLPFLALQGRIHERAGQLDDAVRVYHQAISLADGVAPQWLRSELRSNLAYTLLLAEETDRAHRFNGEAIVLAEAGDDAVALSGAMTTEAMLLGVGNHDAAELAAWQAAITHARRAGAKREEVLGLANIADYYLKRGQYQTALETSRLALPLAREIRDPTSESVARANTGLALISLKRKDEGLAEVRAALAIDGQGGATGGMADTYDELGHYLERAGYLRDALEAFQQHRRLADEASQVDQQQAIVELQEGYDHDARQRSLALLERERQLSEAQLLNRALQQRFWAAGACLALLLLCGAAALYKRMRSSHAQLTLSNEALLALSERDPLTGLGNRRHFQAVMREQCPDGTLAGAVFLIDIDHFKLINDRHGHAAGDRVLVDIARRLRAALRDDDLLVRWGGEEFLVVARALPPDQVEALAQRLLDALAGSPLVADGSAQPVSVSGSIGFARFPIGPAGLAVPWQRAVDLVDSAMYLAKAQGRNRACGVRAMPATDLSQFDRLSRKLEQSWRDGGVVLTQIHGPAVMATAA